MPVDWTCQASQLHGLLGQRASRVMSLLIVSRGTGRARGIPEPNHDHKTGTSTETSQINKGGVTGYCQRKGMKTNES